jgi:hypothetical protein
MNFNSASGYTNMRESAYTMDNLPPVPPIPEDLLVTTNGQSDTRDFAARPKTAPNGSAMKKSRSVKSGVSRGRSGDRRRGSEVKGTGSKPDFSGFLDSIGVGDEDEAGDVESLGGGAHGVGKAPY